jgi:uncharacterized protein (TIGR04255 family)
MDKSFPKLKNAPIVEAVVDIDCDMRPTFRLTDVQEAATQALQGSYPQLRLRHSTGQIEVRPMEKSLQIINELQALQFLQNDEKQLVQIRKGGFSFNRLAPYTSLDDYLPEIKRAWQQFVEFAAPIQIRAIKLRYINRIALPMEEGSVELNQYFKVAPPLPNEEDLVFRGLLMQSVMSQKNTGNEARIVLATQEGQEEFLSFILDIETTKKIGIEIEDWPLMQNVIQSLRQLKNHIFYHTLTSECLELF